VAAVNRAQAALQHYPQAPATEEALAIMVKSYDALGLTELRDDARRVLVKNHPNSKYLGEITQEAKPWWKLW
jgi:outer membrane protein assembly factor BamD